MLIFLIEQWVDESVCQPWCQTWRFWPEDETGEDILAAAAAVVRLGIRNLKDFGRTKEEDGTNEISNLPQKDGHTLIAKTVKIKSKTQELAFVANSLGILNGDP